MNYDNLQNAKTCDPCGGMNAQPVFEPLTGMMEQANNIAGEILTQVNRVKAFLIAESNPDKEKDPPRCFRDAVSLQVSTLREIETELVEIMQALGV
nr:MAG TPA: hypothetical protein [Caudoviricetes sp.]